MLTYTENITEKNPFDVEYTQKSKRKSIWSAFFREALIKGEAIVSAHRKSVTERSVKQFNQRFLGYHLFCSAMRAIKACLLSSLNAQTAETASL